MRERLWACGTHLFVRLVARLVEGLLERGAEIEIFHISLDVSFRVIVRLFRFCFCAKPKVEEGLPGDGTTVEELLTANDDMLSGTD